MIRTTLLFIYVIVLGGYARRDWFVALCGTLLLIGVIQHPDMPKSIFGVQGLNPWNLLMGSVTLSWLSQRKSCELVWDLPPLITRLLIAYGVVIVWAFLRMMANRAGLENLTTAYLVSEDLINCLKWVLPGLILYDTCRTRKQIGIATLAVLGIYAVLAIQVIKWMPLSYAVSGDALAERASKIIQNEIGYNRVNMSMMLSGASWALVAATLLFKQWRIKILILGCAALVVLGQALTGGRMGYATWALLGVILCVVRWRRALPIIPAGAVVVVLFLPGVEERLLMGFGGRQGVLSVQSDEAEITSGRTLIWPYVIDKIAKAPALGYGRRAMTRTGLSLFLVNELNEDFSHPHNAYLEMLLDNGALGLLVVLPFYAVVVWRSLVLFRDRSDALAAAAGGVALALVLALLIAAMGSQTFYPREGSVGMWAAIGIMLRVSVEKRKALVGGLVFENAEGAPGTRATDQDEFSRRWGRVAAAAPGGWAARWGRPRPADPVVRSGAPERPQTRWSRIRMRSDRPSGRRRFVRNGVRNSFR